MEGLVKGDVVVAPFPYSDFSQVKRRPNLVLAVLQGQDVILCQITSKPVSNPNAIAINNADFATGGLRENSKVRPDKMITIDRELVLYKVGSLKPEKVEPFFSGSCYPVQ